MDHADKLRNPSARLKQIFGMLIVIMTAYEITTLFG
jgi:hypothetical protein